MASWLLLTAFIRRLCLVGGPSAVGGQVIAGYYELGGGAVVQAASPQFLISPQSRTQNFYENLVTVVFKKAPRLGVTPGFYSRVLLVTPRGTMRIACLSSGFLHVSVIFFLLYFPFSILWNQYFPPSQDPLSVIAMDPTREILYLPVLKAPGPGGNPGKGDRPGPVKRGGSPRVDLRFTAVSNPPAPDNKSQTIVQPPLPPELRVPHDVPMPDLLLAKVNVDVPQPPKLTVPVAAIHRPQPKPPEPKPVVAPKPMPQLPQPRAAEDLALTKSPVVANLSPKLVLPEPPPPEPAQTASADEMEAPPVVYPGLESTVDLLSLSMRPDSLNGPVSLPSGNRQGEFTVSPNGGTVGALGGSPEGVAGAGSGGAGSGGDPSTGPGIGGSGGGGGELGFPGSVTIAPRESAGSGGELPAILRNWIYPVGEVPVISRGGFVITTGPTGGGGLRVYGVLRGGKVYTTYLTMPGQNWVLEYSILSSGEAEEAQSGAIRISMDNALAPPFPKEKFDFYRPASLPQRGSRRIVLHGVIHEDGTVGNLKVLQGVNEDADELARITFSQWKFRPALRAENPVAVEVLVGIPASGPVRSEAEGDAQRLTLAP